MTSRLPRVRPWLLPLLSVLLFCSGCCALIYQVLWLRLFGLVFGVTVYAASTVFAAFMGGLALGSWLAGRMGDRSRRPLVLFGLAEMLIGLSASLTPGVLDALQELYIDLGQRHGLPADLGTLTLMRFCASFALLMVPTTLMGATLPLVVKSSVTRLEGFGARVGILYGTNTAGAIAGTLLAGFYLIPQWGMLASFRAATSVNLLVGMGALAAAWAIGRQAAPAAGPAADDGNQPRPEPGTSARARAIVLGVFALSGLVAMAIEVVWIRFLILFARPTVYAFALMLACVLGGIAAGSYVIAPWLSRPRRWILTLAVLEAAVAVLGLLSLAALPWYPAVTQAMTPLLSAVAPAYVAPLIVLSVIIVLPTTLVMGMAFPIGLHVWVGGQSEAMPRSATRVGTFYALNVCGGIVGSLAAGFFLLPHFGSRTSLIIVAALALASAIALFLIAEAGRGTRVAAASAVAVVFLAVALWLPDPFAVALEQRYAGERILWREEGTQSTVSVHETGPGRRSLNLDGTHQASNAGSMAFVHARIGTLAVALSPRPERALVVGLGGGATAGSVSRHRGLKLDVVELSDGVVKASDFFHDINFNLLRKPDVRLLVDDGRNYLMRTTDRYDVITADIILPIHAGAGNLYSAEYFRLVRRALTEDGVAMQWFWGTEAEYKLVARTFLSVFREATIWADGSLLVGSRRRLSLTRADFDRKVAIPEWRDSFKAIGIETYEQMLGMYKAGPDELKAYVGAGPILTDDRPLTEYFLALPRGTSPDLGGVNGDVGRIAGRD